MKQEKLIPSKLRHLEYKEFLDFLNKNFEMEQIEYEKESNTLKLFDNSVMSTKPFISLLSLYKVWIAPALISTENKK